ncbi:TPA: aminodeoxychorismate lyase [Escherichia coli]|nr:aminodeoxychorismate lyase [Escherichia coli]HDW8583229.1 aminodeoxychorismate lyase [Escherichia coli]HDW8588001.1 aminodeoxychorismate lyase [Escherichia coli]
MFLINGKCNNKLPVCDRSIQFGDGCFTTALINRGQVVLMTAHLTRLREACSRLSIPYSDWSVLEDEMQSLARQAEHGVLKVIITRGSGGRGYSIAHCEAPGRILSVSTCPEHYTRWRREGITLALSPVRLGRNPHLAGIKHLNRLEQVLIRSHLEQTNADEALVLDSEGWVTECCAANLFWRKGNVVYTPRLDQAGVNGIMRQFCIRLLAQSSYQLVEVQASLEEALQADEMVICNALMPVIPVRACGDVSFSSATLYEYLAPLCERPN